MPPELEKAPAGELAVTQRDSELSKLRRELGRLDTVLFLISAMVVVDTIGAIAIGGARPSPGWWFSSSCSSCRPRLSVRSSVLPSRRRAGCTSGYGWRSAVSPAP